MGGPLTGLPLRPDACVEFCVSSHPNWVPRLPAHAPFDPSLGALTRSSVLQESCVLPHSTLVHLFQSVHCDLRTRAGFGTRAQVRPGVAFTLRHQSVLPSLASVCADAVSSFGGGWGWRWLFVATSGMTAILHRALPQHAPLGTRKKSVLILAPIGWMCRGAVRTGPGYAAPDRHAAGAGLALEARHPRITARDWVHHWMRRLKFLFIGR